MDQLSEIALALRQAERRGLQLLSLKKLADGTFRVYVEFDELGVVRGRDRIETDILDATMGALMSGAQMKGPLRGDRLEIWDDARRDLTGEFWTMIEDCKPKKGIFG